MGNITSMVVLYVGSCKFHRNYVSVSSIIYISFFNHIYVSFCKLPYIFCKDIDKKQNYRLLFYILDRFKLILLNVCYIKLLFRFSAAHLWHNMFAIKHVWMQTCLSFSISFSLSLSCPFPNFLRNNSTLFPQFPQP